MSGDNKEDKRDVDALIALLDGCTQAGESRIRVDVRCDIGSPWACGTAFDVLE